MGLDRLTLIYAYLLLKYDSCPDCIDCTYVCKDLFCNLVLGLSLSNSVMNIFVPIILGR